MKQDLYNSDWINIDGNSIHKTAIIHPNVVMGKGNVIGAYCVIGGNGEIRGVSQMDFQGTVHIGDNNVISEHVTIQRPLDHGKSTVVCDDCIIMAHVHIGHDAFIDNGCEICTSTVIGGYVTVYEKAKIKIGCLIRNRIIIGKETVIGMGSVVTRDVPHFATVYGNPAKIKAEKKKKNDNYKLVNIWHLLTFFFIFSAFASILYSFYYYSSLIDTWILSSINVFWICLFMAYKSKKRKS